MVRFAVAIICGFELKGRVLYVEMLGETGLQLPQ